MKLILLTTFLLLYPIQSNWVWGDQSNPPSESLLASALDNELNWLKAESVIFTEIATRTKMDAELTPGIVTVLKGDELRKRGVRTVFEALQLVPGIHIHRNSVGERMVSVRGIGGDFFSGNLKILLNDVTFNENLSASGQIIYEIPVSQVDRIEIIRGPGSVIYGEYAYAGVINVNLLKDANQIFTRIEGDDNWPPFGTGGGGICSYVSDDKNLQVSLNLSRWISDGPDIMAGQDRLYDGIFGYDFGNFSYAPGPTNEAEKDTFAYLLLKYYDFSIKAHYLTAGSGDYFGLVQVLPPPKTAPTTFTGIKPWKRPTNSI